MKKILAALFVIFAGVTVLCALSSAFMASAASTANSVAVGKLADALQTAHFLIGFVAVLALVGGIGTGAAWVLTVLAIRRAVKRQSAYRNAGWLDPAAPYGWLPGPLMLTPPQRRAKREHAVLLSTELADDSAPDNLFGNWLDQM